MELSWQEYQSGLPFPSPGDLPDPGIKPESPAFPAMAGGLFTTEPPGMLSPLNDIPVFAYSTISYLFLC